MFKKTCPEMLNPENLIDTVAFYCEKLNALDEAGQTKGRIWSKFCTMNRSLDRIAVKIGSEEALAQFAKVFGVMSSIIWSEAL